MSLVLTSVFKNVISFRRMFISTVGENPSVSMYDMNGQNGKRMDAISGSAISLAVHPSASLLYFADPKAETISSIDYLNPGR